MLLSAHSHYKVPILFFSKKLCEKVKGLIGFCSVGWPTTHSLLHSDNVSVLLFVSVLFSLLMEANAHPANIHMSSISGIFKSDIIDLHTADRFRFLICVLFVLSVMLCMMLRQQRRQPTAADRVDSNQFYENFQSHGSIYCTACRARVFCTTDQYFEMHHIRALRGLGVFSKAAFCCQPNYD